MKKYLFVAALAALAFTMGTTPAQAAEHTDAGSTHLTFDFVGLDNLDVRGIWGSNSVGFRRFLQDDLALHGKVLFGIDSDEDTMFNSQGDETGTRTMSSTEIGLAVDLERWANAMERVDVITGVGAGFAIGSEKDEFDPNEGDSSEATESSFAFSAYVLGGFQFHVVKGLMLGGSSTLGFSVGSSETETDAGGETTTTGENSGFHFGFGTMSLYLSVPIM